MFHWSSDDGVVLKDFLYFWMHFCMRWLGKAGCLSFFASVFGKSQFEFKGRPSMFLEEQPSEDY